MAPSWSKALPLFLVVLGSSPAALAQPQTDKRDVAPAGLAPTVPEFPNIQIASALPAPSPVPSALPDARPAAPVLAQSQSSPAPQGSTSPMGPPTTGGLVGGAPPMGQGGPMGGSQGKPADGKAPAAAAGGHAAPPGAAPRGPFLYEPSFSIAVGMAIIFFASFIVTTKQFFKYKAWFLFLLPQAVLMSVLGCVARTHVILNPKAKTAYIIQHLMFSIPLSLIGVLNMITFTRVVWLVTPNSLRNRKNIGLPIHHISFLWGIGWLTSDITKAVATNVGKPKGHEKPNPASMSNRIQTVCMLIMFVVIGCWTG